MSRPKAQIVLHVLPHPGGGGEEYVRLLEGMDGFQFERFYLTRNMSPAAAIASVPKVARCARECDLVQVHGDSASLVCLPVLHVRPTVLTTHGLSLLRRSTGVRSRVVSRAFKAAVARSSATICNSRGERDEVASVVGDTAKLHLIPNSVEIPGDQTTDEQRDVTRHELGLEPSDVAVIWVGALEVHKDPFTFVRAVAEAGPPVVGLLAGDGTMKKELSTLAGDRVRLLGHRHDLSRILPACDAFAMTSEREAVSLAILEAMARRLPVVVSDGPGNPEAVGDDGVITPFGDVGQLAAALRRLAASPELRRELGHRGRRRVEELYDARRMVQATRDVYERL